MLHQPFYDPERSYEENFHEGPFGAFAEALASEPKRVSGQKAAQNTTGVESQSEYLLCGIPLELPFGIPAGPLINGKYVRAAFAQGFSVCTYKTVRSRSYPCHQAPNVLAVHIEGDLTPEKASVPLVADREYRDPLSITNSFGVPSMEPTWWQEDMSRSVAAAGQGQVLVGSFQGTKPESGKVEDFIADYVLTARLVKETGAPVLEANLSCPNEGTADLLCFDLERVERIAKEIKNEIGNTPLILKLAHFADDAHLRALVERVGDTVQGLSAINTIPAEIVTASGGQALPGEGRARSGVCGAGIRWAGLDMVKRLAQLRSELDKSFAIIGVGGVMTPEDFFAYRAAGADIVQSATGAMWNPYLANEIIELNKD